MYKSKSQKGFTLGELLIVVAIIGVLVAVAIPVFGDAQKKARLAADHAAIRDAYALVRIANNLREVEYRWDDAGTIKSQVKTFQELDADLGVGGACIYFLSEGCDSLVTGGMTLPKYVLKEDGTEDPDACPTCEQWDDENLPSQYTPPSKMHMKGWPIFVIYDSGTHQLHLGYTI